MTEKRYLWNRAILCSHAFNNRKKKIISRENSHPIIFSIVILKYTPFTTVSQVANIGKEAGGCWFSQSRGGYNSNPNLSNCPHSSHYTADLIQTFVVAGAKAKFKTAPATSAWNGDDPVFSHQVVQYLCVCVYFREREAKYVREREYFPVAFSGRARKTRQRENCFAKLPIP